MKKLTKRAKYSFGIGAIGKDAIINLVGIYLMFYITDVLGLAAGFVGVLFFVARLFDAVNDPFMGMIVDNTHTRFGKFRPWLAIGTVINAIVFVLLFSNFNLSTTGMYIYISIFYILFGATYTIMDVPYWSWLPNLTNDPREREEVSVIPRFFASFAGMLVGTIGLQIIDFFDGSFGTGDRQVGFFVFAVIIAIVFLITIGITVFNVDEKPTNGDTPKIKIKEIKNILFKNDQLLAFIGVLLSFNLSMQILNGVVLYYFKYVTNAESLFSFFNMAIVAEMTALLLFPRFAKRLTRPGVFKLAIGLVIIGLAVLLVSGYLAPGIAAFAFLGSALLKFGSGLSIGITTVSIADVIDYGEVIFGTRHESIITSTQTFLMKSAQAVAGLLTGVGLQLVGYVPDVQQTAQAIFGIRVLMIGVPLVFAIMSLFIYRFKYKLKGDNLEDITKKLNKKYEDVVELSHV